MSQQAYDDALFATVHRLVTASLAGELTDEDGRELDALLRDNSAARRLYILYIEGALSLNLWADATKPDPSTVKPAASRFLRPISSVVLHPLTLIPLAVLVAVGAATMLFWPHPIHPPVAGPPAVMQPDPPPALIARTTLAEWEPGFTPADKKLAPAQRLKLRSGYAEIQFERQAVIVLQGPAELEIDDNNGCRLGAGQLTARVPKSARGFTVRTPGGTVTDLGTQFGVLVAPANDEQRLNPQTAKTEVHVFQGEVEVAAGDDKSQIEAPATAGFPKSQIVTSGAGVVLDPQSDSLQPLSADPERFVRAMPVVIPIVNHAFEEGPLLGNGKFGHDIPGWQATFNTRSLDPNEDPKFNIEGRSFYQGSDQPPGTGVLGTMAGPQVATLSWGKIVPVFSQTLTETVRPNTKYVLTVAVGVRNLGLSINTRDFGGCYLELLSGGDRLGLGVRADYAMLNHLAGGSAHGSFTDFSYTFVTGPDVPPGQLLGIRISKMRNTRNTYLDFDNVRLLAIPLTGEGQQP
jgi:hypothetical protein